MKVAFPPNMDLDELRRMDEAEGSRRVKRQWIKQGYVNSLSIYGVLTDKTTGESTYTRIEVMQMERFKKNDVASIYHTFQNFKPEARYTIWLHDPASGRFRLVGSFD